MNSLVMIKKIINQRQQWNNYDVLKNKPFNTFKFYPEKQLMFIGTQQQVTDAKMLIEFIWHLQKQYSEKEDQVKLDEKKRQEEYEKLQKCVSERFKFHVALTKYVIGSSGKNIEKAKQVSGVQHINVRNLSDTESECLILATDKDAALDARNILEMEQGSQLIPSDPQIRKELIGRDGKNIQDLEKRSKVIKICTLDHLQYIQESTYNYIENIQQTFIDEQNQRY